MELRNTLRGNTTQEALKAIESEVAQLLDPVPVYICELAAQFILVTFARAYVISSLFQGQPHILDPDTVVYKHAKHAEEVYSKLNDLVFAGTDDRGQPLCTEGERALFTTARQEGWVGECLGLEGGSWGGEGMGLSGARGRGGGMGEGREGARQGSSLNSSTPRSEVYSFCICTTTAHDTYAWTRTVAVYEWALAFCLQLLPATPVCCHRVTMAVSFSLVVN